MKTMILALLILPFSLQHAQVQQQWVQRLSGYSSFNDVAYAMTLDASGNIYVTGTESALIGEDIATIKYNSAGSQIWIQTFNSGNHEAAFAITVDNSGNVYIAGSSNRGLGSDYVIVKYNSVGVEQWAQFYEGPVFEEDIADAIAVDASGNVYVTGYSTGDQTSFDYATIKYNSNGVEQWVVRYNDPGNGEDVASALVLDGSGNIFVTGRSNYVFTTIKYNPSGIQQWLQTYSEPGSSSGTPFSMKIDGTGNISITGMSYLSTTNYDYTTVKYNSSGTLLWAQNYSSTGTSSDVPSWLAIDNSSNVYVTGTNGYDFTTIKYNSAGVQQWIGTYNGPASAFDKAISITVDNTGNSYVTGTSYGNVTTQYDYATVKYNSSGTEQWAQRYNGPGNFYDTPYSIAVDGSGNVYVTGSSGGSGTGLDYATVKYSQLTGIHAVSNEIPAKFELHQNYPNPFNPSTSIKFQTANSGFVSLKIFDVLGKEAIVLIEEDLSPGVYEILWDASSFPSGIYFCKFIAGGYTSTKKMILNK